MRLIDTGVTGLNHSGGYIYEEPHKNLGGQKGIKIFRQMIDNDAVCGGSYYAMESQIKQTPWEIRPFDDSPSAMSDADFVRSCFEDMDCTVDEMLNDVLSLIWAGFCLSEIVYKIRRGRDAHAEWMRSKHNDGKIGIRKIAIRSQDSIARWNFSEHGEILGAYQQAPPDYKETYLPIEDCALFRFRSNKNNPEGRSLYRSAYRSWHFLTTIQELEAIGVERDMAGLLVYRVPIDYLTASPNTAQSTTIENFRAAGERARRGEQAVLLFPPAEDEQGKTGWDVHLLQSGGKRPMDVFEIISRYEKRIAIATLNEILLLGIQGSTGSWALGDIHSRIGGLALRSICNSIESVINRVIIRGLLDNNGNRNPDQPYFAFGDTNLMSIDQLLPAISTALQGGAVTPGNELETYIRTKLGIPEEELTGSIIEDRAGEFERNSETEQQAIDDGALRAAAPIKQEDDETMSLDDAARYVGISKSKVLDLVAEGIVPATKRNGEYGFLPCDLVPYAKA